MCYLLLANARTSWVRLGSCSRSWRCRCSISRPQGRAEGEGLGWFLLSLIVMGCWGVQAFFIKLANRSMSAESIFFYMMVTGLLLAPVAWAMTDFSQPVNWGVDGPWLAAGDPASERDRRAHPGLRVPLRPGDRGLAADQRGRAADDGGHLAAAIGTLPGRLKLVGLVLACIAAVLLLAPEEGAEDEVAANPRRLTTR